MANASGTNRGYGDFTSKIANVTRGSYNQLVVSEIFKKHCLQQVFYNMDRLQ